jgi:hypothetical protein
MRCGLSSVYTTTKSVLLGSCPQLGRQSKKQVLGPKWMKKHWPTSRGITHHLFTPTRDTSKQYQGSEAQDHILEDIEAGLHEPMAKKIYIILDLSTMKIFL